jgi:enterobactin synthetase component D
MPSPATEPIIVTTEPFVVGGVLGSVGIQPRPDSGGHAPNAPHAEQAPGLSELHVDEQALVGTMAEAQRSSFIAGRRALRVAMCTVAPQLRDVALLRTSRGAPQIPAGFTGSVSHKRTRAIAVFAPSAGALVGIDLEERPRASDAHRPSIADRILTAAEREVIQELDPLAHREATLIRFALKEAVYKSIDPYVHRYVRFTEVELDVHTDGRATVRLTLPESSIQDVSVHAQWRLEDRWIVAMARSAR